MTLNKILKIYLIASILALLGAYISQYFFGLKPCILCLYQRVPFFVIVVFCSLALFFKKEKTLRVLFILSILAFFINVGISFYHSGIEQGIFELTEKCEDNSLNNIGSVEELKKALMMKSLAKCNEVQFSFMGLSMASWNFLYCLFLAIFGVYFLRKKDVSS